jgi:polysaccharide transporter, PST family
MSRDSEASRREGRHRSDGNGADRAPSERSASVAETAAMLLPTDAAPAIDDDEHLGLEIAALEAAESRIDADGMAGADGVDVDSQAAARKGKSGKSAGLGVRASRGAVVTMSGQITKLIIQTGGVFLLARLLTPSDYGLTPMAVAIIGFADIVRDFGLPAATVQAKVLTKNQRDNLYWINTCIGIGLALITIACSGLIADLYDEPRLKAVAIVLSLTFVFDGAAAQYEANLQRSLRFFSMSLADILGIALGLIVAVVMALTHFGYWAIVAQQVVQSFVTLAVVAIASRWMAGRYRRGVPMRHFLKFGTDIFLAQAVSYACKNADSVTIGIRFGAHPLGLYNKAFQLLTLPLTQLNAPSTKVAYPILSKLQNDKKRYERFLLTGQTVLLHLVLAVLVSMCALAEPMVRFTLGPRWVGSASLFQILAIAGIFQSAGYVTYWVFLSKGLTRTSLKQTLVSRPITIATVVIGSYWGVHGVAWGYAIGTSLNWPLSLWWISRVSDAPVRKLTWNGIRCVAGYTVAGLGAYAASNALSGQADIVRLLAGGGALLGVLAVEYVFWPAFRRDVALIRHAASLIKHR